MGRKRKQTDDSYWRSVMILIVVMFGALLNFTPEGQQIIDLSLKLAKFAVLGVFGWLIWATATDSTNDYNS